MPKIKIRLKGHSDRIREDVNRLTFEHGCVYAEKVSEAGEVVLRCHTELSGVVEITLDDE